MRKTVMFLVLAVAAAAISTWQTGAVAIGAILATVVLGGAVALTFGVAYRLFTPDQPDRSSPQPSA